MELVIGIHRASSWREVPVARIGLVERLAIAAAVIRLAIRMNLLWTNTLQNMLIQASFLVRQISQIRAHGLITQSELEMSLVVRGHPNFKLHLLPSTELGHWSAWIVQKFIPSTCWHGQICRAKALWAIAIIGIARSPTPHGREINESMPLCERGQEQRDGP